MEVSALPHRPVTSSDLKKKRSIFRGSVSTFLQLVVTRAENHFRLLLTKERFLFFRSPSLPTLLELFVSFCSMSSQIIRACPACSKGNENE